VGGSVLPSPVVGVSRPIDLALPTSTSGGVSEFNHPSALAAAGANLWVANQTGNSITEINPAVKPAAWLGTYSGSAYGFSSPDGLAVYGKYLFVANAGGSVTEVSAATGIPLKVISGPGYGFSHPVAVAVSGPFLLVLNSGPSGGSGSLTEIDADTGALIRVVSGSSYSFGDPVAMVASGSDLWVADESTNSVTELAIPTGALVRVVHGGGLDAPDGIAAGSGYIWVANGAVGANSVTQITAATGATRNWNNGNGNYGLGQPSAVTETAGSVYVVTPFGSSPMVTKIDEVTAYTPWFMCNTNGPYYFSNLTAITAVGSELWVASANGANYGGPNAALAATGSLTELNAGDGGLVQTVP
jgi:hypothetical protein